MTITSTPPPSPPRIKAILQQVAADHCCTVADLLGERRFRAIAHARFDAMWQMYSLTRPQGGRLLSLSQIGYYLGHRDHTTIIHGLRRWAQLNDQPDPFARAA